MEKLEALRTKTALEDGGSPEAADLEEDNAVEETAAAGAEWGYVSRRAPGPSFMDRKLQQLQVGLSQESSVLVSGWRLTDCWSYRSRL